jgi:type IV fimbrial biogenesis protein FimT
MSLIELMIGLVVLGVLLGLGIPAFTTMLQNLQIRTAAEAVVSGLQTARNESVRRNTNVRFQLVNSMDDQCDLVETGPHWVVSRNDPSSKCNLAEVGTFVEPNDTSQPQFLMKRLAEDGTATVNAAAGGVAATTVIFNSVGRASAGSIDTINIANPAGGNCEHNTTPGKMRCMRIRIGAGGQVKMCDPKVTATSDSRFCS